MEPTRFQEYLSDTAHDLRCGVHMASFISPVTVDNIRRIDEWNEVTKENHRNNKYLDDVVMLYKFDKYDREGLWIYKDESTGVLIDGLYDLDFEAHYILRCLLFGYSAEACERRLKAVRKGEDDDYECEKEWYNEVVKG